MLHKNTHDKVEHKVIEQYVKDKKPRNQKIKND